nr:hypothetical protein [Tanacetum cinerariifolium]
MASAASISFKDKRDYRWAISASLSDKSTIGIKRLKTSLMLLKITTFSGSEEKTLHQGTAIGYAVKKAIQDDLRARVDHGKAGRDLSVVKVYDPSMEAKYVEAVNAFGTVDFSLLSELKSKKDASIIDLIDSLCLEGPLAEILGAKDLQPSPNQLRLPIHRPDDNIVHGETSLSFSLQIVQSRV